MKQDSDRGTTNGSRRRFLRQRPPMSTQKKLLFSAVVFCLVFGSIYFGSIYSRSSASFGVVRKYYRGWEGNPHVADPILGHIPVPNAQTRQIMLFSVPVPARFDENRFRVPVDFRAASTNHESGPKILFLGCSYTFGYGCLAEETFPQRTADALDGVCLNAGVSGYGLSQMLIRAKELIPRNQPDIVVVQYSPWLVDRSMQYYSPSYYGKLPCPFFAENEEGKLYVHRPVFDSILFDLPVIRYRNHADDTWGRVSFLTNVGVPLCVYDDFHTLFTFLKQRCGILPSPVQDRERVVEYTYGEISELCRRDQSRMIIVNIQFGVENAVSPALRNVPDALIVDAHQKLLDYLPEKTDEAYRKAYCHWGGDPPVCVDSHPNAERHRIISEAILSSLNSIGPRSASARERERE